MERTFYRIVRSSEVTEDDFLPARVLGRPLRRPELARQWAEGVSVFTSAERAAEVSRRFRFRLGRYLVTVSIGLGDDVEVEPSGDDPFQYTLYGTPSQLRSLVVGVPIRIDGG